MGDKKILVTGCGGFLGSKLISALAKINQRNYSLSRQYLPELSPCIEQFILDIRDEQALLKNKQLFSQLDILIHLAAYVPKHKGEDKLVDNLETNLQGSVNLLNVVSPQTKFIFASTTEVYGIPYLSPLKEEYPLRPITYYGGSKAAAEMFLRLIARKNKTKLTILRFTSIYGPGERIERVIPNFIKAVLKKERPVIYGTGKEKRDYLYIDDAVNYLIRAISRAKEEVYHIASGERFTINQLLETIKSLSGSNLKPIYKQPTGLGRDYVFDLTKARRDLQIKPRYKLRDGLKKEIRWFQKKFNEEN